MRMPELSLDGIKKSLEQKPALKTFRASDFLSQDETNELRKAVATGKKKKRQFDDIDALGAEICARFGYDAYLAWKSGEIETEKLSRWLAAERSRDNAQNLYLEAIVIKMVGACVKKEKGQSPPKGLKEATKLIREQIKKLKGEG